MRQKVKDVAMSTINNELQVNLWMYQHCKNTNTQERLSPRCVRMFVPGFWRKLIENHVWNSRQNASENLFPIDLRRIDQQIRQIPVDNYHPLLKEHHTLYSIRRGSLQHLAASGISAREIQHLTRHVSESSLRAYLGSFLDPHAVAGLETTRMLGRGRESSPRTPRSGNVKSSSNTHLGDRTSRRNVNRSSRRNSGPNGKQERQHSVLYFSRSLNWSVTCFFFFFTIVFL